MFQKDQNSATHISSVFRIPFRANHRNFAKCFDCKKTRITRMTIELLCLSSFPRVWQTNRHACIRRDYTADPCRSSFVFLPHRISVSLTARYTTSISPIRLLTSLSPRQNASMPISKGIEAVECRVSRRISIRL